MNATLQLNLADALSADELHALVAIAADEEKTIEKVLFEAAQERAAKRRAELAAKQLQAAATAA